MSMRRFSAVALMVISVAACGGDDDLGAAYQDDSDDEEARDPGDSGELADASEDEADVAPPVTPVDPASFKVLLAFLPSGEGWTAGEPNGSTTAVPGYKVSVASNEYRRPASDGSQEQIVSVEITDGGFAEMISAPFEMMSQMSTETTEGYQKGVMVGGHPAYEQWTISTRRSELNALVAKRFLIHLTGVQVEPAELRQWLEGMRLSELAELAAQR